MSNLISIPTLLTTDTFYSWLFRTNTLIQELNNVNIYDIDAEPGSGITILRTDPYNGVPLVAIFAGRGVGFDSNGATIISFDNFDAASTLDQTNRVANDDWFIVSDVSDNTQSATGTTKRVQAQDMLPEFIDVPVTFSGDIVFDGNTTIQGNSTFIAANDLRIEDKQILLAFQRQASFNISSGTAGTFVPGATAFYDDVEANALSPTAEAVGFVKSWDGTTLVVEGPFSVGGVEDFQNGGWVSSTTGGASGVAFQLSTVPVVSNDFLSDSDLDTGGIVLKGASGDKTFLWYNETDAWQSNVSLGVSSPTASIIGSVYESNDGSSFRFIGKATQSTFLSLSEGTTADAWKIEFLSSTADSQANYLSFSFREENGSYSERFSISPAATGNVYAGVDTSNFAEGLNADLVDGAHATQSPTAFSIPVSRSNGRLDPGWLAADAVEKSLGQTHDFELGEAIAISDTGEYIRAQADSVFTSELVGLVNETDYTGGGSGQAFNVVQYGYMNTGLTGLSTGSVYFLDWTTPGGITTSEPLFDDEALRVKKPVLIAESATAGYVLAYAGAIIPEPTDQIESDSFFPVGAIVPYAGNASTIPAGWLNCNGGLYKSSDYPDLSDRIRGTYSVSGTAANVGSAAQGLGEVVLAGGTRNIDITTVSGMLVDVSWSGGSRTGCSITEVRINDATITVDGGSGDALPANGTALVVSGATGWFFVPDLKGRKPIGQGTLVDGTEYALGALGGVDGISLTADNVPSHTHGIGVESLTVNIDPVPSADVFTISDAPTATISTQPAGGTAEVDVRGPYVVTNYIIRATPTIGAVIRTGHVHDDRYIRYDGPQPIADNSQFLANAGLRSTDENDNRYLVKSATGVQDFLGDGFTFRQSLTGGASTVVGIDFGSQASDLATGLGGGTHPTVQRLPEPTLDHQAANKSYVDSSIAGAQRYAYLDDLMDVRIGATSDTSGVLHGSLLAFNSAESRFQLVPSLPGNAHVVETLPGLPFNSNGGVSFANDVGNVERAFTTIENSLGINNSNSNPDFIILSNANGDLTKPVGFDTNESNGTDQTAIDPKRIVLKPGYYETRISNLSGLSTRNRIDMQVRFVDSNGLNPEWVTMKKSFYGLGRLGSINASVFFDPQKFNLQLFSLFNSPPTGKTVDTQTPRMRLRIIEEFAGNGSQQIDGLGIDTVAAGNNYHMQASITRHMSYEFYTAS